GPFDFHWNQDGKEIEDSPRKHTKTVTENVAVMTIEKVTAEDLGNYTCTVSNAAGSSSHSATLVIEASVACVVIGGMGPFGFGWTHNGKQIVSEASRYVKENTENIATVTIEKVNAEDVGNYTCTVSNSFGRDSHSAALIVEGRPDILPFSFSKNSAIGRKSTVTCVVSDGLGPFRFLWTKDGKAIENSAGKQVQILTESIAAMTIESVAADDLGNYTCTVYNDAGSSSYSATLAAEGRPEIMPFSFSKNTALGQKSTVSCVVSLGEGPFHFLWTQDGQAIRGTPRKHVKIVSENVAILTIEGIAAEDLGNYTCTVSNAAGSGSYSAELVVEGKPDIMPFSFSKNAALGQNTMLTCAVTGGSESLEIQWSHNGRRVENTASKYATFVTANIATLTIETVSADDMGNYTCTASNRLGRDSYTTALVVEGPPEVQPFAFSKNIALGQKALVNCGTVGGDGPFKFRWVQDGRDLQPTSSKYAKTVSETFATLVIEAVGAEDVGNYTCTVSNAAGEDSFTAPLTVKDAPKIQPFSFPTNPPLGKDVAATCFVVEGHQPLKFQWFKDGRRIDTSARLTIEQMSVKMATLTVHGVSAEDIGNYTCQVSNGAGSDKFTSHLVVTDAPRLQPFSFPKEHPLTETLAVSCIATRGTPPLVFSWLKDGRPVSSAHGVVSKMITESISTLAIPRVGAEHLGNYTCRAENDVGSDTYTSTLVVAEPPRIQPFSFPKNPPPKKKVVVSCVAVEGDEPLSFTWLKGGRPVTTGKRIAVRRLQVKVSEAVSSLTIVDLSAEDIGNYTCVVTNAAGSDSFTSQLLVTEAPRLQPFYFPKEHPLTETLVVSCIASRGTRPLVFSWFKDGRPVDPTHGVVSKMLTDTISTLTISRVGAEHLGNYTCRAANEGGRDSYTATLVVSVPPRLQPFYFPKRPELRKKVVVHCVVFEGDEPLTFSWYKDGRKLATNRNIHVKLLSETVTSLTLVEADASDIGNYTCEVVSGSGDLTAKFQKLQFFDSKVPPLLQKFQFKDGIGVGDQTTVVCAVIEGDLPLEFRWSKDDKVLVNSKATSLKTLNDNIASLTLHKISASDLGNYTCSVQNADGTASVTAALVVRDAPKLQEFLFPKTTALGESVSVSCAASKGIRPMTFAWLKDGVPVVNSARVITSNVVDNVALLVINKLAALDVGNYSCVARNAQGEDRVTATLTVEAAPVWLSEPKDTDAVQGRDLILACNAAGFPKPRFTWKMQIGSREFVALHPVGRRKIHDNGTLVIESVESDDEGLYQCDVSNGVAPSISKTIKVSVHVPPRISKTSSDVSVKRGDIAKIACEATGQHPLVNDYGQTKHSFRLTVLARGSVLQEQEVDGMRTSLMVTNLHPGTEYLALALAENSVGFGDPSDTCEALDTRNIKVSWEPPPADQLNGELKGYYIGHKMEGTPFVHETVNRDTEQRTFRGLQAASVYRFMLKAFNEVGSGPPSEEVSCATLNGGTVLIYPQEYEIQYGTDDGDKRQLHIPATKEAVTLTELRSGTRYNFRMAAFNLYGRGDFSHDMPAVTHLSGKATRVPPRAPVLGSTLDGGSFPSLVDEEMPFYYRTYFVVPVVASFTVIITAIVIAWACLKRATIMQSTPLVSQYARTSYVPTMDPRHSQTMEEAYDIPWNSPATRNSMVR
ncbi:hypothetical protein HPB47_016663, partial [Ixodes persulcatus]